MTRAYPTSNSFARVSPEATAIAVDCVARFGVVKAAKMLRTGETTLDKVVGNMCVMDSTKERLEEALAKWRNENPK